MQISYTDTVGERKVVEKEVKIGFQNLAVGSVQMAQGGHAAATQNQGFFAKYQWYIFGLVVLIVGWIIYQKYTAKKKQDPKYQMKDLFRGKKK
ncbi:hypothetical protein HZB01_05055 [Candidatus Woesearchaeota archaeon]|nr:hypothetical protein [Candidatus Woesearchaeota archaeon]